MGKLVLRRLVYGAITLLILVTGIFFSQALLSGDIANAALGREASPEAIAAVREKFGLDQPLVIRYGIWLWGLLHGDIGTSLATGQPISVIAGSRLGNTFFLATYAAILGIPTALVLGLLGALYRNSLLDRVMNSFSLAAISIPDFLVAYMLILAFSILMPVFPSISTLDTGAPLSTRLHVTFLPAFTLSLFVMAHTLRMTRAAVIDILSHQYIEMANLKGLSRRRIVLKHALPNATAPIINVICFNLAYLVLGVVVIEVVFAYPGLGGLLVDSVTRRDIPLVQAACLCFAATFLVLNLVADICALLSNPALRGANGRS